MRRLTIGWREVKTTLEFHGNVTGKIDDFNFIQFIRTEFGNNPNFILFYLFMYFFFSNADIVQDVFKISKSFPNDEDLSGAAFSLAQLQGAYRLNVSQLASGNVQLSDRISFPSVRGLNGI